MSYILCVRLFVFLLSLVCLCVILCLYLFAYFDDTDLLIFDNLFLIYKLIQERESLKKELSKCKVIEDDLQDSIASLVDQHVTENIILEVKNNKLFAKLKEDNKELKHRLSLGECGSK